MPPMPAGNRGCPARGLSSYHATEAACSTRLCGFAADLLSVGTASSLHG
jgi:hypothetical protein